jgi:hypothetical protein
MAACPAAQTGGGGAPGMLTGTSIILSGNGPSRWYLTKGPAPANTVTVDVNGKAQTFDSVMYI